MKSFLKTEKVRIEALELDLEIRELSVRAWEEINASKEDSFQAGLLVCKHGVVDWANESIDDMKPNVPMRAIDEIAKKVYALSGITTEAADLKNSESVLSVDSSSASH